MKYLIILPTLMLIGCLIMGYAIPYSAERSNPVNLYRVTITSHQDASRLSDLGADVFFRLYDGYLVLVRESEETELAASGLEYQLVATDLDRTCLALDNRQDQSNVEKYPIVFEEKGLRIFQVDRAAIVKERGSGLASIPEIDMPVIYYTPPHLNNAAVVSQDDLETLVNGILEDSLLSYSEHLQTYNGRWVGSSGNISSALWARDKFINFGYDSVVIDTFTETIGTDYELCRNIIAYKTGTVYPYIHTILMAHRDTDFESPGADDNGSGVAAVLEAARVLKDIETQTTIVFLLTDAEEEALRGARHYAAEAFAANEKITFVQNLDMIAHFENDQDACVFQAYSDDPFALLWAHLADSIPSISLTGYVDVGGGVSDHMPFQEFGYDALCIHEYILSSMYHTIQDSTTYMNFDYLTRMTRTIAATAYVADQQFSPECELYMATVNEMPEQLYPNKTTPVNIFVREYGGAQLVPGTVLLHYSVDGGEESTEPMTAMGNDVYSVYLPPFECLQAISYYFSAEDYSLGVIEYPDGEKRFLANVGTGTEIIFADYFETDKGWTVTTNAAVGEWERTEGGYGDYDGNDFWYFAKQQGTHSPLGVWDGCTSLESPPIEISGNDCLVEYARWCVHTWWNWDPSYILDTFSVWISGDGYSWTLIEKFVAGSDEVWKSVVYRVSDFMTPPQSLWLRFDACEYGDDCGIFAGVDAVTIMGFSTDFRIITNEIPGWTAGWPMSFQIEAASCDTGAFTWIDRTGALPGTGLALSSDGLLNGVPSKTGFIMFYANVSNQLGEVIEKKFVFSISDTLEITTNSISAAGIDEAYDTQLGSTGGTGEKRWIDRDGGLAGSGITLSSRGRLFGASSTEGEYTFTARVTDEVGAFDEKQFTLRIIGPYVCGDANSDESVNVADAVYLINHVFRAGPSPAPLEAGDANCDGSINVGDAVYLINYVFKGGPEPCCP